MLSRPKEITNIVHYLPASLFDLAAIVANTGLGSLHRLGRDIMALSHRISFNISRLNLMEVIFSPTQLMTDLLIKYRVRAELIRQSPFGIDLSGYQLNCREKREGVKRLAFIGTLSPHKGCHILIEAFRKLRSPALHLKIYGNLQAFPDYAAQLQIAAKGIEAIEFCGTFPNHEIANILAEIDALVVPSLWYENTPLVIYSAFAARCPVIASHFRGISEVVKDRINGILFSPGNVDELAERLQEIAASDHLLPALSANCLPPKSSKEYVDDLLAGYQQQKRVLLKHDLPLDLLKVEPN